MKKIFYAMIALAIGSFSFTSCDDDNDDEYLIYQVVGDFIPETNQQRILMDDKDTVLITNKEKFNNVTYSRIMMLVEIISERKSGEHNLYEARVVDYQKVLTKEPILTSFIAGNETHRRDSIGNDFIAIYKAEVEANYLNIVYTIQTGNNNTAHFINLVIDDTKEFLVENGEMVINAKMHHNAYGDPEMYRNHSYVSFKMDKYLPMPGIHKITINIENGKDDIKVVKWENKNPIVNPLRRSNMLGIDYLQSVN